MYLVSTYNSQVMFPLRGRETTMECVKASKYLRLITHTASKVSVFGVFLVRIFPHLDWIQRNTPFLSITSLNAGKYGPENSEYGHFSRSVKKWISTFGNISSRFDRPNLFVIKIS